MEEDTSSVALSEFPVASVRTLPDKNPAGIRRGGTGKMERKTFTISSDRWGKRFTNIFLLKSC